jgi:hypothetical protein
MSIVEENWDLIRKELEKNNLKNLREEKDDDKIIFTFNWLLPEPMRLMYDASKNALIMSNILEDIPSDSAIFADILLLVDEFSVGRGELLSFETLSQKGAVSIVCKPKHNDYTYATEKILLLVNNIFQKIFEDYPSYTKEKFNQLMVNVEIKSLHHTIPVILSSYEEGVDMSKTYLYRSPGSLDLATLPNENGEYYYEMGDFFLGGERWIDNVHLPILGFIDWHDKHYKVMYPIYEEVKKEGNVTFHKLVSFGTLDLSEVFNTLQKTVSIIRNYLSKLYLSIHEQREVTSRLNELPSHPMDLYLKYDAPNDAANFILVLLDEKESYSLKSVSKKFSKIIDENDRKQIIETINLLKNAFEYCRSANSYDDSLQHTIAFRKAVRIAREGTRSTNIRVSNIRNISRSGAGKSVYLGKEELEWVHLGDKVLVKIVEYQPFRSRIEIYPF